MRSSLVKTCATITPQIGVVALRIEARPLAMWVWPQPNRVNGHGIVEQREQQHRAPDLARQAERLPSDHSRNSHIAAAAMVSRSQT